MKTRYIVEPVHSKNAGQSQKSGTQRKCRNTVKNRSTVENRREGGEQPGTLEKSGTE